MEYPRRRDGRCPKCLQPAKPLYSEVPDPTASRIRGCMNQGCENALHRALRHSEKAMFYCPKCGHWSLKMVSKLHLRCERESCGYFFRQEEPEGE